MLEQGVMTWIRRECNVQLFAVPLGSSNTQVVAGDPDRFAAILRADIVSGIVWGFAVPGATDGPILIPANTPSVFVSEDVLGQAVQMPIVARGLSGAPAGVCMTMSYVGSTRRIYDKLIRQYLSQYGAL